VCAAVLVIMSEAMLVGQALHLQKEGHSLNDCILEESKLAHWIAWNEAKIFLIETTSR